MAHGSTRTGHATDLTAEAAARQAKALRLRRDGMSYEQIASRLGYADRSSAHKAVKSAIAEITKEPAADVKALELRRLDDLYFDALRARRKAIACGDIEAQLKADTVALKVSERRSKLEGLDAPTKVQDVSLFDSMGKEELEAKAAELREKLAAVGGGK